MFRDASKSKPKLIKVQSKANRSLGDPNSFEKKPFVQDGDDIVGSIRHVTSVGKPLMVFPGMGSPGSRSARLKGSPTGSGLETDGDTDSMTKIDIDGGRERLVSPSGVKAGIKGSPSIASLRRGVVYKTCCQLVIICNTNDKHFIPCLKNHSCICFSL